MYKLIDLGCEKKQDSTAKREAELMHVMIKYGCHMDMHDDKL